MLEGVALEYRIYLEVLRALNPELAIHEIRVTGGGEKSHVWNAIKADGWVSRSCRCTRQEGAPMGVAMLAGFGIGLFSDLDATARQWIKTGRVVRPRQRFAAHYVERLARYRGLLDLMQQWSEIGR